MSSEASQMMSVYDIKNENNMKTFHFIILNCLLGNFFLLYRIIKIFKIIEKFSGKNVISSVVSKEKLYILMFLFGNCATIVGILLFADQSIFLNSDNSIINAFGYILSIALIIIPVSFFIMSIIIYIKLLFGAKYEIEKYSFREMNVSYNMSSFYTIIFGFVYINYCLNDLSNEYEKFK